MMHTLYIGKFEAVNFDVSCPEQPLQKCPLAPLCGSLHQLFPQNLGMLCLQTLDLILRETMRHVQRPTTLQAVTFSGPQNHM